MSTNIQTLFPAGARAKSTLVWGSLRLAPIIAVQISWRRNQEVPGTESGVARPSHCKRGEGLVQTALQICSGAANPERQSNWFIAPVTLDHAT